MLRWIAYVVMAVALGAAVFLHGGVVAAEWAWCGFGLSIGSLVWVAAGPKRERSPGGRPLFTGLSLLLAWMVFQLVPLPPAVVAFLSPERWSDALAMRTLLGESLDTWLPLSVAPPATTERLLFVLPAMAVFIAAREMAWWWKERLWISFLPVVIVTWLQSVLGLVQFYFARLAGGSATPSTGTYVNRNHYSGLLELAFPLVVMWAVATWRRNTTRHEQPLAIAVATAALLGVSTTILMGVILSLSRMGFLSTLAATGVTLIFLLSSLGSSESRISRFRWAIPVVGLALVVAFLPTQELILRFADMAATEDVTQDTRAGIWRESWKLAAAYPIAGCGLGSFQQCFYAFQTVAPVFTIDFAHNDYLQMLAELGAVGGLLAGALALWVISKPIGVVLSGARKANWELAVGLLGSLLVLGLHSLTDFNLYIPANAAAFAWIAGVAVSPGLRS